ncbi:carbohydrate-binding family 9-like protein [Diplocloster modestus]|uniref:Carbohydrate-binding domain-containing protein n=1 Tax=Diplocloster modestus TaxID=2850322 RepID=A0ABS6K9E5_9FIRM|nr:carbohydrate-binding family 9-like protein [Diplocloster modestus]MBU9727148.1 hypothetical protein [Diplocloster modestus]
MCDTIFYPVLILNSEAEIGKAQEFHIRHYNWGGDYRPSAYGRLGVLRDKGILIRMTCEERPPEALCHTNNGPVYQDSAMEFFFCLDTCKPDYFNFEINSAGAVLAQYGPDRAHREFLSEELLALCDCRVDVGEDSWQLDLLIPFSLTQAVQGKSGLATGSRISCNFYKIRENPDLMHFASCFPIDNPTPNFHLPQFFGNAEVVESI